jgi:hypothetical protein
MMPARTQSPATCGCRGAAWPRCWQRAFAGQAGRGGVERGQRGVDAAAAGGVGVGVGEVRHQRDLAHLRQRVQPRPCGAKGLRAKAQAVHAAVELEEHPVRQLSLVRRQPVDLLAAVHRVPEVQARAQLQVARLEHAFEQQHRAAPAQRAHALGLGQVEQREAVGAAQAVVGALDAVAVGVGLDHGPDAGIRRAFTHPCQVVQEGVAVDQRFDRSRHRAILPCETRAITRRASLDRGDGPARAAYGDTSLRRA